MTPSCATAGLLLFSLAAAPAVAATVDDPSAPAPDTSHSVGYRDGQRWVIAERLPLAVDGLQPVRLHYPAEGLTVEAGIDATAIVTLRQPGADDVALLRALGVRPIAALMPAAGIWQVAGNAGEDGLDIAARLQTQTSARLHGALPNLYLRHTLHAIPNDPRYPGQWYFDNLAMHEAWDLSTGSAQTTIVVIDNGCDTDHPDLRANMDMGHDTIDQDDDPSPLPGAISNEHGTACAGIVAAVTNNGVGIAGGCPNCRVRCVRLLSSDGEMVPLSADVAAFNFALEVDAAVVSNSWGFTAAIPTPQALADAIDAVFQSGRAGRGSLVFFAAGNDDRLIEDFELSVRPSIFTVGAVDRFNDKAPFTNFGPSIDLVAPTGTLTTDLSGSDGEDLGDYTSNFGGTSSACPVVAGVAGLLASEAPELYAAELYELMRSTASPAPLAIPDASGHDEVYGYGVINPRAVLAAVISPEPPPANDEGCDCSSASGGLLAAAAAGVVLRRRRR